MSWTRGTPLSPVSSPCPTKPRLGPKRRRAATKSSPEALVRVFRCLLHLSKKKFFQGPESAPQRRLRLSPPPPCTRAETLGLSANLLRAIKRKGFRLPTPIQRKTLPAILQVRLRSTTFYGRRFSSCLAESLPIPAAPGCNRAWIWWAWRGPARARRPPL